MSALPPKADITGLQLDVPFVPKADSCAATNMSTLVGLTPEKTWKHMMMNIDGDGDVTSVCHMSALIISAARPPIMYDAALVPGPEIMDGITEASATRSPRSP